MAISTPGSGFGRSLPVVNTFTQDKLDEILDIFSQMIKDRVSLDMYLGYIDNNLLVDDVMRRALERVVYDIINNGVTDRNDIIRAVEDALSSFVGQPAGDNEPTPPAPPAPSTEQVREEPTTNNRRYYYVWWLFYSPDDFQWASTHHKYPRDRDQIHINVEQIGVKDENWIRMQNPNGRSRVQGSFIYGRGMVPFREIFTDDVPWSSLPDNIIEQIDSGEVILALGAAIDYRGEGKGRPNFDPEKMYWKWHRWAKGARRVSDNTATIKGRLIVESSSDDSFKDEPGAVIYQNNRMSEIFPLFYGMPEKLKVYKGETALNIPDSDKVIDANTGRFEIKVPREDELIVVYEERQDDKFRYKHHAPGREPDWGRGGNADPSNPKPSSPINLKNKSVEENVIVPVKRGIITLRIIDGDASNPALNSSPGSDIYNDDIEDIVVPEGLDKKNIKIIRKNRSEHKFLNDFRVRRLGDGRFEIHNVRLDKNLLIAYYGAKRHHHKEKPWGRGGKGEYGQANSPPPILIDMQTRDIPTEDFVIIALEGQKPMDGVIRGRVVDANQNKVIDTEDGAKNVVNNGKYPDGTDQQNYLLNNINVFAQWNGGKSDTVKSANGPVDNPFDGWFEIKGLPLNTPITVYTLNNKNSTMPHNDSQKRGWLNANAGSPTTIILTSKNKEFNLCVAPVLIPKTGKITGRVIDATATLAKGVDKNAQAAYLVNPANTNVIPYNHYNHDVFLWSSITKYNPIPGVKKKYDPFTGIFSFENIPINETEVLSVFVFKPSQTGYWTHIDEPFGRPDDPPSHHRYLSVFTAPDNHEKDVIVSANPPEITGKITGRVISKQKAKQGGIDENAPADTIYRTENIGIKKKVSLIHNSSSKRVKDQNGIDIAEQTTDNNGYFTFGNIPADPQNNDIVVVTKTKPLCSHMNKPYGRPDINNSRELVINIGHLEENNVIVPIDEGDSGPLEFHLVNDVNDLDDREQIQNLNLTELKRENTHSVLIDSTGTTIGQDNRNASYHTYIHFHRKSGSKPTMIQAKIKVSIEVDEAYRQEPDVMEKIKQLFRSSEYAGLKYNNPQQTIKFEEENIIQIKCMPKNNCSKNGPNVSIDLLNLSKFCEFLREEKLTGELKFYIDVTVTPEPNYGLDATPKTARFFCTINLGS